MQKITKILNLEITEKEYIIRYLNYDGISRKKIIKKRYPENIINKYFNICKERKIISNNIFIERDNEYILVITDTEETTFEIFIDQEDIYMIDEIKWLIQLNPSNRIPYIRNSRVGFFHRYIMKLPFPADKKQKIIVDHIDRNTLNNKKSNLRVVNNSLNQRNKSIQKNNTSGIPGVRYNPLIESWTCRANDLNGKRITSTFSINKYGYDEAKKMAINKRNYYKDKFGYL